jgi:hypothetical protein
MDIDRFLPIPQDSLHLMKVMTLLKPHLSKTVQLRKIMDLLSFFLAPLLCGGDFM